ncbi:hypothetical protein EDEG_01000 [Edhazardia aedis USNM 41457]|uniref:Uncharacterized protein n=1 Tax=Edhazardia aedis (strain USNM 41457) TaxID=1003232 RepID=J9DQH0_EDHAE|nr:hypothetical protein EDEG_01000 [Edhazardia aedis USNM 41457]|eukprot:EJW04810.1 hypothetical protein EDEG_01000 [Edhazardia aedis USNM 41457]
MLLSVFALLPEFPPVDKLFFVPDFVPFKPTFKFVIPSLSAFEPSSFMGLCEYAFPVFFGIFVSFLVPSGLIFSFSVSFFDLSAILGVGLSLGDPSGFFSSVFSP